MTLATLGWAVVWCSLALAKWGWAAPANAVYLISGIPATLGVLYLDLHPRRGKTAHPALYTLRAGLLGQRGAHGGRAGEARDGHLAEAELRLRAALDLLPSDSDALFSLGVVLSQRGDGAGESTAIGSSSAPDLCETVSTRRHV